jgi:hypothetical protein
MFVLLFLPYRVMLIFFGFSFRHLEDFGPLLSLTSGLTGAYFIRRSPQEKPSIPLVALLLLLSLWPILPNLGIFLMAREFQAVHGSWPQVTVDNPENWLGLVSPQFDTFHRLVDYLEAFSGAWMVAFLTLFFAARPRFSVAERRSIMGLLLLWLIVMVLDPGNLYVWWMD